MNQLFGAHEQKADFKGRVLFPSALKRQLLSVIDAGFILKRSIFEKCLELYPMDEWKKEVNNISQLNRYIKENNDFIRAFMSGVKIVELDDAGRLLIPKDLIQWAEIEKDVVLASSINRIEIWSKTNYEVSLESSLKDFGALAEKVTSKFNSEK